MEFGIDNRKRETMKEIKLPNQENIRMFREKENYKYLGILELVSGSNITKFLDGVLQTEMREKN